MSHGVASARYTIMVSAGEASGDEHAAHALAALTASDVLSFESFGMGAGSLAAAGTELIVDSRDLSVIGFVDVLVNYPKFLRRLKSLREAMRSRQPNLLLLVDYPDFNLKLAETARAMGIPVLFYISPQVWAWRSGRVSRIGRLVDHMAVLFPFEVPIYENAGIPVTYVGNPLVDEAVCSLDSDGARRALGLNPSDDRPVVALLPGSRSGELARNLPVMLATLDRLNAEADTPVRALLPVAPSLDRAAVAAMTRDHEAQNLTLLDGSALIAMRAADVVLVASGTATLQTALIGTPMVVMYVISRLNYAIMRRLIQIPDIALVNIVAGRRVVPEFVQQAATPEALADELQSLLTDAARRARMQGDLADVQARMGDGGASGRVAALITQMLAE